MAKPSKKATIITVAILAVLLIVAIVAVTVFLRDKGSTEAAGMNSKQTVGQNENAESKASEEPSQETQSTQESSTPSGTNTLGEIASNANQQTTNEGTTQNAETQGTTSTGTAGTSNAGTSGTNGSSSTVGTASSNGTTTSTENIQESTITRTETVDIPERKVSENHNVWWEPMSISALLASANPTTNDIVDVIKSGDEEIAQGETINYTIKVTNKTNKKLEGIEVKDVLPEEVDLNSIQYETQPNMVEGNIVKWNVDIEPNGYVEIKFSVKVKTTVAPDTEIKNSAIANGKTSNEVITKVDKATTTFNVSKDIEAGDSDASKVYTISGVVVTLNGTDGSAQSVTLDAQNGYKHEFTNLAKYDAQGNEITYTAEESALPGEEEAFTHYTQTGSIEGQFVNTFDPSTVQDEKTELSVHKDIVTNNSDASKEYAITGVVVTLEGTDKEPITLNEANNYTGKFTELKKYDEEGNFIKYNAVESALPGEEKAFKHYKQDESKGEGQFVNTFDPTRLQDKTSITVTKTWNDMENKFNTRPEKIIVNLKADGKVIQKDVEIAPDKDNIWTYTFKDLNVYDSNGNKIDYTVEEERVPNYNYPPTYTETENGYNITNTADLKEISIDKTVLGIKQVSSEDPDAVDTEIPQPTLDENGIEKTYNLNASLGDTIIYNIKVNNDGNTKLNNVTVTDDKSVTIIGVTPINNGVEGEKETVNIATTANETNLLYAAVNKTTLNAGEGYIFTVSYKLGLLDIADASEVSNNATVDSDETEPEYSTSTVTTSVKFDHELTKEILSVGGRNVSTTTPTDEDGTVVYSYDDAANKGETIRYKITAENKGTTTIENLKLTDNRTVYVESIKFSNQNETIAVGETINAGGNLLDNNEYKLAPGETVEVIVTYVIGSMEIDNKDEDTLEIVNITKLYGDAFDPTSNDPNNQYKDVEDEAKAEITATMKANITISKKSDKGNSELQPGDTIKYTVTLTNSSTVEGTAKVTESVPEGTTLVGNIKVTTSKTGTGNPEYLDETQIEAMEKGELELIVPGKEGNKNGIVVITFTIEVQNSAIATTVKNQASTDVSEEPSETIENPIKKALNIYETKTELGKQSVVIVVDMTLSLAAGVDTDNIDRLAYAPVNEDGTIDYQAGYENTRWFKLKKALNDFIDSYLGTNIGNKKSVAIVGFCNGVVLDTGFMTDAGTAKGKYENVFTQDQYTAAVDFARTCLDDKGNIKEDKIIKLLKANGKDVSKQTPFKVNKNDDGTYTYDIDVDILPYLDQTGYKGTECELGSGTNIASGLEKGNNLVESQTNKNIPTDLIVITDGENNKGDKSQIPVKANEIMSHKVNGENSKLYAIGFTKDAESFESLLNNNMTEYYPATDTSSLNSAFKDIEQNTERNPKPNTKWATTENAGWVLLKDIEITDNSKITFYTGDAIQTDTSTTIVKYDSFEEFKDAKDSKGNAYYNSSNKTFNLKQFLIDYKVAAGDTINMEVYTVE